MESLVDVMFIKLFAQFCRATKMPVYLTESTPKQDSSPDSALGRPFLSRTNRLAGKEYVLCYLLWHISFLQLASLNSRCSPE